MLQQINTSLFSVFCSNSHTFLKLPRRSTIPKLNQVHLTKLFLQYRLPKRINIYFGIGSTHQFLCEFVHSWATHWTCMPISDHSSPL